MASPPLTYPSPLPLPVVTVGAAQPPAPPAATDAEPVTYATCAADRNQKPLDEVRPGGAIHDEAAGVGIPTRRDTGAAAPQAAGVGARRDTGLHARPKGTPLCNARLRSAMHDEAAGMVLQTRLATGATAPPDAEPVTWARCGAYRNETPLGDARPHGAIHDGAAGVGIPTRRDTGAAAPQAAGVGARRNTGLLARPRGTPLCNARPRSAMHDGAAGMVLSTRLTTGATAPPTAGAAARQGVRLPEQQEGMSLTGLRGGPVNAPRYRCNGAARGRRCRHRCTAGHRAAGTSRGHVGARRCPPPRRDARRNGGGGHLDPLGYWCDCTASSGRRRGAWHGAAGSRVGHEACCVELVPPPPLGLRFALCLTVGNGLGRPRVVAGNFAGATGRARHHPPGYGHAVPSELWCAPFTGVELPPAIGWPPPLSEPGADKPRQ